MTLIDLPFTKGLDQSVDETSLPPPGLVECLNYRLTRAGRLEHRLGVVDVNVDVVTSNGFGRSPNSSESQGLYGRFLAAGGYGYTCLSNGVWAGVGTLSRFVPLDSFASLLVADESYVGGCVTSANGYVITMGFNAALNRPRFVIADELTGTTVYTTTLQFGGTNVQPRVVACGTTVIFVYQDGTDIKAIKLDLSVLPFPSLPAEVVTLANAQTSSGFDIAPYSSTQFLLTCVDNTSKNVQVALVDAANIATTATLTSIADGANAKLATVCGTPGENVYACWLDRGSLQIRFQALTTSLVPIGAVTTVATAASTALYNGEGRPVIGRYSSTQAIVGWTDSYGSGNYSTYRTSFTPITNSPSVLSSLGTIYGYGLASKPFQASTNFGAQRSPCIWLLNTPTNAAAIDSHYFLMQLGTFSGGLGTGANKACSWELSCGDFKAWKNFAGVTAVLSDCITSTAPGTKRLHVAHTIGFRGKLSADPQTGIQTYSFGDGAESIRHRARQIIPCKGTFAITGGAPRYHDTSQLVELGMSHGPDIVSAVGAATGSMAVGSYSYVAAIEYFDAQGQRQLSIVSAPKAATVGVGQAQVQLEIVAPGMWALPNFGSSTGTLNRDTVCHIYRTSNGGTVYRRVTPNNGAPSAYMVTRGQVNHIDTLSDAQIQANEAIYVQVGNVRPHFRAPACRFGTLHGNRLVVGGLWSPYQVKVSKLLFPEEGIQFADFASFTIICPEPVTGVASLDGTLILFCARSIYTVNGDGPTDDGAGSFTEPVRMPGRIGCLDWRSIVTTDLGVYFRSAEGIYLLPRGLGTPAFVGAPIKDKLRRMPETLGATLVTRSMASTIANHDSDQTVSWLVGDAESPTTVRVFTFSLTTQTWAEAYYPERTSNEQVVVGPWYDVANDTEVLGLARRQIQPSVTFPGSILIENVNTGYDQDMTSDFFPLLAGQLKTGKIFPFGFGGRGTVKAVRLVGECLDNTILTPTVYDDATPAGTVHTDLVFTTGRFAVEIPLRRRDLRWLQLNLQDPSFGLNRGPGLRLNGLVLEIEGEGGLARSEPGRRAG